MCHIPVEVMRNELPYVLSKARYISAVAEQALCKSANNRRLPHFCWLADKSAFALLLTKVTKLKDAHLRSQIRKILLNDGALLLIEQKKNTSLCSDFIRM